MSEGPSSDRIAAYESEAADTAKLQDRLTQAWRDVLADDAARSRVAALLEVPEETVASWAEAPVTATPGRSGLDAGEVAIIVAVWVANEVVLGAVADLAKDALKTRLQRVWDEVLEPRWKTLLERMDIGNRNDRGSD